MTARPRQILACSGVLYPPQDAPVELVGAQVRQAVALSGAREPRVCFVPTAVGDSPASLERWYAPGFDFSSSRTCRTCRMCGRTCWPSAWHVTRAADGGYQETPVPARYWLPGL